MNGYNCTKCGQAFVASSSPGGAPVLPPPLPPMAQPYPQQAYGYPPARQGMSGGAIAAIVIGVLFVVAIPCLIAILLPALNKVREEALKANCSSNLKNIAAAMITYSNANNGNYPDSMVTLIRASGMNPMVYVCPASSDTPLTVPLNSVTAADLPGHCSYVYVAGGLNSSAGPNDVLAYDSPADHRTRGVNVLYGDYRVVWLPMSSAQQMIQSLPTGVPTSP